MFSIDKINWLVGIIEGEGCIALNYSGKNLCFNMTVTITNTDLLILYECKKIIDSITNSDCKIREHSDERKRQCYRLVVSGQTTIKILLETIIPLIVGNKKPQAELLLQFINRRLSVRAGKKKSPKYTEEDLKYLEAMKTLRNILEPVETVRFLSRTDKDTVRTLAINETNELGRNALTLN